MSKFDRKTTLLAAGAITTNTVALSRDAVSGAVDGWFNKSFENGPLARHTEAYNQVFSAKPALVDAIIAATAQPSTAAAPTTATELAVDAGDEAEQRADP